MSARLAETGAADEQLASFVDRILAVRKEIDDLQVDVRDLYKEAKGVGFDKTAIGTLVAELRRQAKDPAGVQEADAILDLYREAYQRATSHTHTREAA